MEILPMRTPANTKGLKELISSLPSNLVMSEIGCYAGLSTKIFMESGKVKTLYAIDIWEDVLNLFKSKWKDHNFKAVEAEFDKNLKGFNIVKLKMNAKEAQDQLPQLDFAYIDGNHHYEYVKEDIQICLKKIKNDGIIGGHDYCAQSPGVIKAVNEMFGKPDKVFSDASWIVKLKK